MGELRVGTRGSALALKQTRGVCERLHDLEPELTLREVVIRTYGDARPDAPIDDDWPMGGFVSAIEQALLDGSVDFAVHSFKDLPTLNTPGLCLAAVPEREVEHDVLVLREPIDITRLPKGFRIGTGSPRRAAQWRRYATVEVVPIRGNVPTRLERMERLGLDGVVLAAAGLRRLGINPPHAVPLPLDPFLPAPAQGALAVQARVDDERIYRLARLEHAPSRLRVEAERSLLTAIGPGCHTPVAALATIDATPVGIHAAPVETPGGTPGAPLPTRSRKVASRVVLDVLNLRGQLFADDTGTRVVEAMGHTTIDLSGSLQVAIERVRTLGKELAAQLIEQLT